MNKNKKLKDYQKEYYKKYYIEKKFTKNIKNIHKNVLKILSRSFIKFLKLFIISKIIKGYNRSNLLLNKTRHDKVECKAHRSSTLIAS